ncbi:MAG: hypothetical protein ABI600_21490 [Luteolibacter sp.]
MILLTVVAVGLLTLSSVALRTSSRESDLFVARSNARLGMMMAINQLQGTLGPDQRVTAPADLKFPSAVSPKWVGVYGNQEVADYSQKPSAIPAQPYKPALLNWLVSGNETVLFASSKASASFGQITTPPSSIPYNPTDAVSLTGTTTVKNQKAALLVSGGSTNSANSATDTVVAPITAVRDSAGKPRGGYAYWVADEGMKARIDLRDNYRQQTAASDIDAAKSYSFVTSQRSGIEMMRKDSAKDSEIGTDYDPASSGLPKLATTGQLALLSSGMQTSGVVKNRFHDVTAYSQSVLADSYAGGLKQDMSAVIYGGSGPADGVPLFTPESSSEFGLPTWGHLRSWAKFTAPLSSPPSPPPIAPKVQPYTPTQTRFGPVISVANLAFGVEKMPGNQVRIQLYPALILWNPYDVGIPAADYELAIGFRAGPSGTTSMGVFKGDVPSGAWDWLGDVDLAGGDAGLTGGSGYFRFKVKGSEIPAGESHIYLADNPGSPYVPGVSALVRAPATSPIGYNTRYLTTSRTFSYAPGALSDPYMIFWTGFGDKTGMPSGDRREVILTEPGGMAGGFSQTTPVYQALLDMNIHKNNFSSPSNNPALLSKAGLQPIIFFRSQLMMESRGGFSGDWARVGAMFQPGASRGQERNRWIANHNPLAPYIKRTKTEMNMRAGAFSHGNVLSGEHNNNNAMIGFQNPSNYRAGIGWDQGGSTDGPLLDVLPTSSMLLSLGQFQHAQLNTYGFGTTYTFGNAGANVDIPRDQQFVAGMVARPGDSPTDYKDPLYDVSWHANRALWDRYFVSTASAALTQADIDTRKPLPNARMVYYNNSEGKSPKVANLTPGSPALKQAAANLMVAGGFNINSTSVDAWRAVLTGTNGLTVPKELANPLYATTPLNAMIPRFSRDVRTSDANGANGLLNMWGNVYRGNRELLLFREAGKTSETPAQAQERLHKVAGELAERIVAEIRLRGPFLSLSDFVNRKLAPSNEGIRGTLQAAIDRMTIDEVNPKASLSSSGAPVDQFAHNKTITAWDAEHYMGTPVTEGGNSSNYRTAMAPKHLTQADLLSTIGPALSARSDTFVIRSYGEAVDPATNQPTARAWCEAVVQRTPDYIDPADDAATAPQNLTKDSNKSLGRRFKIVSFRWLSNQEI